MTPFDPLLLLLCLVIFIFCTTLAITIVIRCIYFLNKGEDPLKSWKREEKKERSIEEIAEEQDFVEGGGWVG